MRILPAILFLLSMSVAAAEAEEILYSVIGQGGAFGMYTRFAGDVNADGYEDVIISVHGDSTVASGAGKALIISGADGTTLHTLFGHEENAWFGRSVVGAGDINGDGYADVIAGDPYSDFNQISYSGAVFVYSGKDWSLLFSSLGTLPNSYYGIRVNTVRDVNLDGFDDFAFSRGSPAVTLDIYSGKDSSLLYSLTLAYPALFLAPAGDVNEDGYPDILVNDLVFSGQNGSKLDNFWRCSGGESPRAGDGAGDVNGDGYSDVVLGYASNKVCIYSGKDGAVLHTFVPDYSYSGEGAFGLSVSGAGDVNLDGYDDVLVGDYSCSLNGYTAGMARLYSGRDGSVLYTFLGEGQLNSRGWNLGEEVDGDGDVNGDGIPDLVAGAYLFKCPNDDTCGLVRVYSGDQCPNDSSKTMPEVCGCGTPDTDSDSDGVPDCIDNCPLDPGKVNPGSCGCGVADIDTDGDGTLDCNDSCPNDPSKVVPGTCGCGIPDSDRDGDGVLDCLDSCPNDPLKVLPGQCGCGIADADSDGDGTANCNDACPTDPVKITPGVCGCGIPDKLDRKGRVSCPKPRKPR